MRILITGGCGFLGHHIVEHFLRTTDHELVVLDKLSYASAGFDRLRAINAYGNPRVHVIGCDLSRPIPQGVGQEVGAVEYVVHAAAETHVDNSIADPLPFLQSNVIGTHHLLWWLGGGSGLRAHPCPRRIFLVSTDEVYGPAKFGDDVRGFDEQAPFRPANPYAAAKAGGECVGMAYANTYGLPITIVNTMNLIGERQHPEKFVPLVIRSVLRGETVKIHSDAKRQRSGTRFYLHARTYADALAWLINGTQNGTHWMGRSGQGSALPLKLHVCGEVEWSNLELAQRIADIVGITTRNLELRKLRYELVDFHSSRPGHDLRYAMNDDLIRDMGWRRPMSIAQSLEKTVRWYLDHAEWLELKK